MKIHDPAMLHESDVVAVFIFVIAALELESEVDAANHSLGLMSFLELLVTRRTPENLPFLSQFGPKMLGLLDAIISELLCGVARVKRTRDRMVRRRRYLEKQFPGSAILDLVDIEDSAMVSRARAVLLRMALISVYDLANAQEQGDSDGMLQAKERALKISELFCSDWFACRGAQVRWIYLFFPISLVDA